MIDTTTDQRLLLQCGKSLKEWQSNWAVAIDCLESIRPIIGFKPDTTARPDKSARRLLEGLFQQVPSTPLSSLRTSRAAHETATIDLSQMQSEYVVLQEAVRTLQQTLRPFDEACKQSTRLAIEKGQEAVVAQLDATGGYMDHGNDIELFQIEEPLRQPAAGAVSALQQAQAACVDSTSTDPQSQPLTGQLEEGEGYGLGRMELWLMATSLCQSLHKQLDMLVKVSSSLNLVTPAEELSTYISLLKLQPYVDERLYKAVEAYTVSD